MTWPSLIQPPASQLLVRTKAVVVVVDDVTGKPPSEPPAMRLQRLLDTAVVDLDWRTTLTLGGAVVFDGHMDVDDGNHVIERYKLIVEGDRVQRPDRPNGYYFTVGDKPTRWPVRLVVRLLPGPAYQHQLRLPTVHGSVAELVRDEHGNPLPVAKWPPVPDAVVVAFEDGGLSMVARCATDERGSFSLGLPSYRPTKSFLIRATAQGFQPSNWRRLRPVGPQQPFQLPIGPQQPFQLPIGPQQPIQLIVRR
jgi:hypothetical protein